MSWNYRIVTKLEPSPLKGKPPSRLFSIAEVYYADDKSTNADSYADGKNILSNWETIDELKWTAEKVLLAFEKPILDLDNWPNEYKEDDK